MRDPLTFFVSFLLFGLVMMAFVIGIARYKNGNITDPWTHGVVVEVTDLPGLVTIKHDTVKESDSKEFKSLDQYSTIKMNHNQAKQLKAGDHVRFRSVGILNYVVEKKIHMPMAE